MSWSYNNLWIALIRRNMKKTDLKDKVGLTSNTIARMGKNMPISMEGIGKLCQYFNCRIEDIVEYIPDEQEI